MLNHIRFAKRWLVILTKYLRKHEKTECIWIWQRGTWQYDLVSNIYSNCQYICATCEYNISSIWITKYLELNPTEDLDRSSSERFWIQNGNTYICFSSWIHISIYCKRSTKENDLPDVFSKFGVHLYSLSNRILSSKTVWRAGNTIMAYRKLQTYHTKAIFVRGPNATTVTFPGLAFAWLTKNSAADSSMGFPFGGGKFWLPSPSAPWTKSAMRSFVPFYKIDIDYLN